MKPKKNSPCIRTDKHTYAVRDIVVLAMKLAKSGKKCCISTSAIPICTTSAAANLVKANLRCDDEKT